ncbi:MAG: SxtJ family membrane protein [Chloroflexota bacterium]
MIHILRIAWQKWRAFAHVLGNFQARVLLTVFYFVLVGPIGLVLRWRSDPLKLRFIPRESYWLERETRDLTLEDARRQS